MRGSELPNGFRVFDNPDCLIIVCYKTARCGFHAGCPTEAPSRQHFCSESARPPFARLATQHSSLLQPDRGAFSRPQPSKKTKMILPLVIFSSFCLRNPASRLPPPPA